MRIINTTKDSLKNLRLQNLIFASLVDSIFFKSVRLVDCLVLFIELIASLTSTPFKNSFRKTINGLFC